MKRKFILFLACALFLNANLFSQERVKAFSHLSVGVEAGTTGFGLNVATTLSKNFALRGGIVMLPLSYSTGFDMDFDQSTLDLIDQTIADYPVVGTVLQSKGLPTTSAEIETELNATAKLGLINGKLLVDYYPWAKASFHLTTGLYFGSNHLIKVEGGFADQTSEIIDVLEEYKDVTGVYFDRMKIIEGYNIDIRDMKKVDASIGINALKPYIGLGFGRAVPLNRVGVQFDLGGFFHGTPALTSQNAEVQRLMNAELSGDIIDIMEKIKFYPVLSLKIVCRIF
ncbi:hypothetical protein D0T49_00595 [Paludibacter sp. 221]|uniref:hypothetical protein n=1 Tax=Paludibacter sp. 221 TaxID=2302939 RepID=UPI0013D6A1F1|nr:hypothetical protein [Paludibacter sp. 221]NDV45551.1 hypothetical protein [Paludibacter sp. 221]